MINTPCMAVFSIWSMAAAAVCGGTVQETPPPEPQIEGGESAVAPEVAETPLALPASPRVRPAPVTGFNDEAAYLRSIAERVAELVELVERADDAKERIELSLSAANMILAHQLESLCTRRLLDIEGGENGLGEGEFEAALARADALIRQADAALGEMGEREDLPAGWSDDWKRRSETLDAFAMALREYLFPREAAEAPRAARRAASRLSPLLEDGNPAVAGAAALWQACLRSSEEDLQPALSVLNPALSDPLPDAMPYAFFSRLLRCRLTAQRGAFAAALSLLMQIEERCRDWLDDAQQRDDAVRAAQFVRLRIMARWFDSLASSDNLQERQWCVRRMGELVEEGFGESGDTVLRLAPVVPVIAPIPPTADAPLAPED